MKGYIEIRTSNNYSVLLPIANIIICVNREVGSAEIGYSTSYLTYRPVESYDVLLCKILEAQL
jgi:hypothetical protein